jgi:hypothetical protein
VRRRVFAALACVALAALLWPVTRAVQDRLGLDSVAALFLNLALFIGAGFVIGLLTRRRLG